MLLIFEIYDWVGGWYTLLSIIDLFGEGGESSNDDSEEYLSVCLSLPGEL